MAPAARCSSGSGGQDTSMNPRRRRHQRTARRLKWTEHVLATHQYEVLATYPTGPDAETVVLKLPNKRTFSVTRAMDKYFTFAKPS